MSGPRYYCWGDDIIISGDSASHHSGFPKFLKKFTFFSLNGQSAQEIMAKATTKWFELTDDQRKAFSPLDSPTVSSNNSGFMNFLEEFTMILSADAVRIWENMSDFERARYSTTYNQDPQTTAAIAMSMSGVEEDQER